MSRRCSQSPWRFVGTLALVSALALAGAAPGSALVLRAVQYASPKHAVLTSPDDVMASAPSSSWRSPGPVIDSVVQIDSVWTHVYFPPLPNTWTTACAVWQSNPALYVCSGGTDGLLGWEVDAGRPYQIRIWYTNLTTTLDSDTSTVNYTPRVQGYRGPMVTSVTRTGHDEVTLEFVTNPNAWATICLRQQSDPTNAVCADSATTSPVILSPLAPGEPYQLQAWFTSNAGALISDTIVRNYRLDEPPGIFALDSCVSYTYGNKDYNDLYFSWDLFAATDSSDWEILAGVSADTLYAAPIYSTIANSGYGRGFTGISIVEAFANASFETHYWIRQVGAYGNAPLIPLDLFPLAVDENYFCGVPPQRPAGVPPNPRVR